MEDKDSSPLSYDEQITKDFGKAQDYLKDLEGSGQDLHIQSTRASETTMTTASGTTTTTTTTTTNHGTNHGAGLLQEEVDIKFWVLLGLVLLLVLAILAYLLKYYIKHCCLQHRIHRARRTGAIPRRHSETGIANPAYNVTSSDRQDMTYKRMSDHAIRGDKVAFFALAPELGDYNEVRMGVSDLDRVKLDKLDKIHLMQMGALAKLCKLNATWETTQRNFSLSPFDLSNPRATEVITAQIEFESALYKESDGCRKQIDRQEGRRHGIINKIVQAMMNVNTAHASAPILPTSSPRDIPSPKPRVPAAEQDTAQSFLFAMEDLHAACHKG